MRNFLHFVLPIVFFIPVATYAAEASESKTAGAERSRTVLLPSLNTSYTLEAECAVIGSEWITEQDPSASSGRFVVYRGLKPSSARPAGTPESVLRFELEAVQAGQFNLFARARTEQADENDLWVRVNDGDWLRWEGFTSTGAFAWNPLSTTPLLLDAGNNTVDIVYKSVGIQIDKIHVDVDMSTPVGEGETDPGCPDLPSNLPPVAVATASPASGTAPLPVTFDGSGSSDPDGNIVSYNWDLGSRSLSGTPASTTFSAPGIYVVTLTVTDDDGATAMDEVTVTVQGAVVDSDGDGVPDASDNCPTIANPDQQLPTFYADADGDGLGDPADSVQACEAPEGYVANADDNCPGVANPDGQLPTFYADADEDGLGDPADSVQACEAPEGYVANADDNCPTVFNPDQQLSIFYADADGDGLGDPADSVEACEAPEGYVDNTDDNCPTAANPDQQLPTFYADADGDGFGDPNDSIQACTVPEGYVDNADDNCPDFASTDLTDTDGDGIGDACDPDIDNDGVANFLDCDPLDSEITYRRIFFADSDADGIGDTRDYIYSCEKPDGYVSRFGDNCPKVYNPSQADTNGDGIGDACQGPILTDGNYWLEGECATLSTGWAVAENTLASNNAYVLYRGIGNLAPPSETNQGVQIETSVEVFESATYHLFFRMNAWRSTSNSFWVQLDDGPWINFSKFIGGTDIATSGFQWVKVNDEGTDVSFSLEAGVHTLRVANRSSYTMLDKVLLSTSSVTPSGLGGQADNCGQNTVAPEAGLDFGKDPVLPTDAAAVATPREELELYPNPVTDRFSMRLTNSYQGSVTVLIADATGRTIRKSEYLKSDTELEARIDVSQLPLGNYTVRIIEGGRQQIRKFVKLR